VATLWRKYFLQICLLVSTEYTNVTDTQTDGHRNMLHGWKENSMLTNCLAPRAHLTITVSEIQRDICGKKIVILLYPLAFDAPVRGFPSEYRHSLWFGKTRMVSLRDGEKISKVCLFVLTWSTNVTDGRTDGHCMAA